MAKLAHLKGPKKEGQREPVYFATHADYVEGLNDKLETQEDATTTTSGLMSSSDKVKLNGIATGAQVNVVESVKVNGTALPITNKAVNIDISGKVDTITGKGLSTNDYTTTEKNKLAGIAANANNYSLPTASSSTLGGVKIGSGITISNGTISVANATTSANGLMTSTDKTKLDGVATGANNYSLPIASSSTLGGVKIGNGINISSGTISIANATTSANGLMSSSDKSKLDGVATGAQANIIESIKVNGTALSVTNKAVNLDISGKVDKVTGKGLSTNDYTTDEKNKLAGIATGANNYSLPDATATIKGGITIGNNISVSNGKISITKDNVTSALGYTPPTTNTTYSVATTSANGLMSSSDKSKLDGIATGANNYSLPTASSSTKGGVKIGSGINISNETISISNATTSANGLMTSADKIKLDGIENTYVPRAKPTAFSIPVSAWNENSSEASEFIYYADITVNGLTSNDYAEVNFNRTSQSVAIDANLCASGDTLSGKIRIYAEKIPESNIGGEYIITKGAV